MEGWGCSGAGRTLMQLPLISGDMPQKMSASSLLQKKPPSELWSLLCNYFEAEIIMCKLAGC